VLSPDTKMLKSPSGGSISGELLDEGVEQARQLVDERSPRLGGESAPATAQAVGVGAIKYADLVNDRKRCSRPR
jgi:arginyl-tRNA synthetase